ncbi:hypothetical protein K525DRAFT_274659 [Schizophyllum commune Loenen D]|nr:hypothetical protein K525DRAFT_274659 [Schizophyllum commune Loenen D]
MNQLESPERRRTVPDKPEGAAIDIDEGRRPINSIPQRATSTRTTPAPQDIRPLPPPYEMATNAGDLDPQGLEPGEIPENNAAGTTAPAPVPPAPLLPAIELNPPAPQQDGDGDQNMDPAEALQQQMPPGGVILRLPEGLRAHVPAESHLNPHKVQTGVPLADQPEDYRTGNFSVPDGDEPHWGAVGYVGSVKAVLRGCEPYVLDDVTRDPDDHVIIIPAYSCVETIKNDKGFLSSHYRDAFSTINPACEGCQINWAVDATRAARLVGKEPGRPFALVMSGCSQLDPAFVKMVVDHKFISVLEPKNTGFQVLSPRAMQPSWFIASFRCGLAGNNPTTKSRAFTAIWLAVHNSGAICTWANAYMKDVPTAKRVDKLMSTWDITHFEYGSSPDNIWQLTGKPHLDGVGELHEVALSKLRSALKQTMFSKYNRIASMYYLGETAHPGCAACFDVCHPTGSCKVIKSTGWNGPKNAPRKDKKPAGNNRQGKRGGDTQ